MIKAYILLITLLTLTSCGATGSLIGTVVRLPIDIIASGAKFDSDGNAVDTDMLSSEAIPLHLD